MKKIFSSPEAAEVELFKNVLADAGIECEARNSDLSGVMPVAPFYEELWVSETDYPKASELLDSWERTPAVQGRSWTCPACGEVNEAQFTSCWKCGTQRDRPTAPA
jgi:hypothetical protein